MATYTIYGDLLFLTNFLMDFTLLFGVYKFGNFKSSFWRICLVSLFGAGYGVLAILPEFSYLNVFIVKIVVSMLMVYFAFPHCNVTMFFRAVLYFYLMSFAMAGAVMAISWLIQGGQWQGETMSFTALALGFGMLLILFLSRWSLGYIKETLRRNQSMEPVEIFLGDKKIQVNALMDTGNELLDPISKSPVIVAEFDAVKPLLPLYFSDVFQRKAMYDVAEIMEEFLHEPLGKKLRLIPFSSIGKRNGMMIGIKPDAIGLPHRKGLVITDTIVCLYWGSLHTKDQCRCIINPAILNEI